MEGAIALALTMRDEKIVVSIQNIYHSGNLPP